MTMQSRLGDEDPGFDAVLTSATVDGRETLCPSENSSCCTCASARTSPQAEIGRRIGVSQMHVSHVLRAAIAQIVEKATGPPPD